MKKLVNFGGFFNNKKMNIFKIDNIKNYKNLFSEIPFKIILFYNIKPFLLSTNEPIFKLISKFPEIQNIIKIRGSEITKLLYYHIKYIHEILYESEEIITLSTDNDNNENINISYYFYLDLLIKDNLALVNYKYSLNTILYLYNLNIQNCKQFKGIIKTKIIIYLINNFKDHDDYDENKYKDELPKIEKDCKDKNNNNNIIIINECFSNLNNIKYKTIGDIYKIIIIELINKDKFDDYDYIINIIEELDLESIDIIKIIFEELLSNLNNNEMYIKNYLISNINDLNNHKKINFNYILLKYLLKDPIYIYQIPCLLKTRNNIIKLIKNDLEKIILLKDDKNIKLRIEYIIEIFTDLKYYFLKYIEYIKNSLNEILNYYKIFLFESKKEDIILLENEIKKNRAIEYKKYISELNTAKKLNKRAFIIKHLISKKNQGLENELKENIEHWEDFEKKINEKKYSEINENKTNEIIIQFFSDENNEKSLLNIFNENIYTNFIEYIISQGKITFSSLPKSSSVSILTNIANKYFNEDRRKNYDTNSFSKKYSKEKNSYEGSGYEKNPGYILMNFIGVLNTDNTDNNKKDGKKENKMKLIEYIREINNKLFLVGGLNGPINIYNKDFKNQFTINNLQNINENWKYNTIALKSSINKEIKLAICCLDNICLSTLSLDEDEISKPKYNTLKLPSLFCLEIPKNQTDFFVFDEKSVKKFGDLFSKIISRYDNKNIINNGRVRTGIWIEENVFAFATMDNLFGVVGKKNKIIMYNINNNKNLKEKEINYNINLSQNSLALMEMVDNKNKKVLLFGCKKYIKRQKNGILIVNYNLNNEKNKALEVDFEKTNFEVYCFCQISKYENNGKILNENCEKEKTNYFLVGGLDTKKSKGVIKLYKLIYDNKIEKIKIQYIDDAFLYEKKHNYYNKFKGAISCIVQLEKNGNVLVGCWDGNVYRFTPPNIDLYENANKIDLNK